ncbi:hypothetical protein SAMN02745751_03577 [Dethiosulfatibacter aminovorans DSM 17477]|uniref:Tellurite resistance protein TerB n=1 Tax=Dethiosulfatibacter aminovorans DSM 17477 TaxID=1121476 RepID=A0A1M6MST0_9FIRM|nr:hypothetical protein [Dethiosulfatibacter aminovorans]SHJ86517.1 hypothetical protein SAMN02745751_03577 [Dethiosulfatibacter aminovorans DSM 17477]
MFLNALDEIEKKDFIDIARFLIDLDGKVVDSEENLLNQYVEEMALDEEYSIKQFNRTREDLLRSFVLSDKKIVRMVFIELVALATVDKELDISEENFIRDFMEIYDISENTYNNTMNAITDLNIIYSQFGQIINS